MVFQDMLQSRVAPSNITFSILVKLHFEAGQIAAAFQLVDEMASKHRCVPSRIVYTVLLRCCGQQGGAALARAAAILTELALKRNSKLPDQGMVGVVISGCVQNLELDLASRVVREFAAGAGAKRGSTGLVPLDCLRGLFEAFGAHDEPRGQELLEFLKRRSIPSAHVTQLQAALADGRRQGPTAQVGQANAVPNASAVAPATQGGNDAYAQWMQPVSYPAQPYAADTFQPYNFGYQPQMQQIGQMAYFGGFPQPQSPTYPAVAPVAPQFLAAAAPPPQVPGPMPPVAAPEVAFQPGQYQVAAIPPGPLPSPPSPVAMPPNNATAGISPPPQATTPAPAQAPRQAATGKKTGPRRSADKENTAPQRPKAAKDGRNQNLNLMETPSQPQAI